MGAEMYGPLVLVRAERRRVQKVDEGRGAFEGEAFAHASALGTIE